MPRPSWLESTEIAHDLMAYIERLEGALQQIIKVDQVSDVPTWGQQKVDGACASIAREALR